MKLISSKCLIKFTFTSLNRVTTVQLPTYIKMKFSDENKLYKLSRGFKGTRHVYGD